VFRLLRAARRLRGSPFDAFGLGRVRSTERALPREYRELVRGALERLTPETRGTVVALCETPELIRGYERIKLDGVGRYRTRSAELLAELAPAGS
jgi:indolepyruvate ferredoxin oxidoreductase